MSKAYILAIDQGTSSTKAILFDHKGKVVKKATAQLKTDYLPNGFVEQDPHDIVESVKAACSSCLGGIDTLKISSIGISNQRETFVLWDKNGKPVHKAIVWACKRSTAICDQLKDQEPWLKEKTGLVVDPYFSGTKLLWILKHKPEILKQITKKEIFFGTVDTWLLFKLTNGKSFYTDHSNASRTLFFNIHKLTWDSEIIEKWNLTGLQLPEIKASADDFGVTDLFGLLPKNIPVTAMIGDSHGAMFGETCFEKGDTKMTLGTGCSLLMHIGNKPLNSNERLLSTIGWSTKLEVVYAWEGAIVACGSMVEWLKSLQIISNAEETAAMAMGVGEPSDIYLVPAFGGLGAPFWQMNRKASIHGLTFGTRNEHLVKATLESISFQIKAVVEAMQKDLKFPIKQIAMHGGLSKNEFIRLSLSDLLDATIQTQDNVDISAQGAAFLAGLQVGIFKDLKEIKSLVHLQTLKKNKTHSAINEKYDKWRILIK
ncbi:glycerol kinase GlpK [Arenibacter sp. GZD96]|uniref:FGGY family carbohydrate kinase n=1 Tax=Aurantibrevibacter litoralis TaxID=3106030 RepID=UPI002AFFF196|nr:glycerol kinase GlpK [Arenibacter sp. GZD-96]MEA1787077.1 glycerol kinase GlpK [Arenibacter sp. GZD-96]